MVATTRAAAKAATERLLLSSGIAALARRRRRDDVLILTYHNVVPDDAPPCGDPLLHLPRSEFAAHLDLLARTHDVVPLVEALRPRAASGGGRPRAAVTFDDAYVGAMTLGVAELEARDMPATVFVAPAFVGGGTFWWDRVVLPTVSDGDASAFRRRAIEDYAGRDGSVRQFAAQCGFGERDVPAVARCATETELSHALSRGTLVLGSHSWSHPNLSALPGDALHEELTRPLRWLRERFERVVPILAYPYGRCSDAAAAAARAAGYSAALRNDGGWLRPSRADELRLPRVDVPNGLSRSGFALRTAGLFAA